MFAVDGSTWTVEDLLTGSDGGGRNLLGTSVALSADGRRAVVGAPGLSGVGIAYGVSGESEEPATGADAEKAKAAAVKAAGGGRAVEVERDDEGGAAFEVEIERSDGKRVEIAIDSSFRPAGTESEGGSESDEGSESEDEGGEDR